MNKRDIKQQVRLRNVVTTDLELFFAHQQEQEAIYMAAFTAKDPSDRQAFDQHWARIRANSTIATQTILFKEQVAGHISSFEQEGDLELTYWLGQSYWGQGIATEALNQFLAYIKIRPLYARVVKDNNGSRRVLEKCGFAIVEKDRGFAQARQAEVEEFILKLEI